MADFLPWAFIIVASVAMIAGLGSLWLSLSLALSEESFGSSHAALTTEARSALFIEKEALLQEIRDVAFEHDAGKLSDADFEELNAKLRAQARRVLHELDAGAEGVVCITISQKLSATYAAAVQAAGAFEAGVVEVVDSEIVTIPQGMIVKRVAELASTGAGQADALWGGDGSTGMVEDDVHDPPRYFAWRSDDQVRAAFGEAFTIERFEIIPEAEDSSVEEHYQLVTMRKP